MQSPVKTPRRCWQSLASSGASGIAARSRPTPRAIDSARGRAIYSQRIANGEPASANIRHTKRLDRFTLRGKERVSTQCRPYCLVHIEKLARDESGESGR
ncbi:hypothetical protein HHL11_23050 [Ramlibacter sp. G-1-2-2]|uniref:Transposase DDE domain-containing protein n=1 Tax=Ramlibacter agri TaxID=2728837 RepID=A0A848H9I0_9BURK|nr:hypothetical protein [Ramlibacter agri]